MIGMFIGLGIFITIVFIALFCMLYVSEKYDEDLECFDIDKLYKRMNKRKKRK